jgi:RND family efflux transporter MFP subunit
MQVFVSRFSIALLLLAGMSLMGCGDKQVAQKETVRPVRAVRIGDTSQLTDRTFPGQAKATQEVDLSFRVAGPLITRPVNIGDLVKTGDIVARIDPRDFEVNLRSVQAQLKDAEATLKRAEADFQRSRSIFEEDPGAISKTAVDRAEETRDRSLANVDALTASVTAAEDALSYTYLRAPFDGRVVATYVENFEDVRAKQAIVRILDSSKIEMVISIPESLISFTPGVRDIEVTFDAFPDKPFPAVIKEIGAEASQTTRTYPVTLIMDQRDDVTILPGMAGRASGRPPDEYYGTEALEVPVSAVFSPEDDGKTYVWVIDDASKTVSSREVATTQLTDRGIRIASGLEAGEWIATAGVNYLEEGQQVSLLQE